MIKKKKKTAYFKVESNLFTSVDLERVGRTALACAVRNGCPPGPCLALETRFQQRCLPLHPAIHGFDLQCESLPTSIGGAPGS
jgi:hypothetical protein